MAKSRQQRVKEAHRVLRAHHKRKHASFKKHEVAMNRRMRAVKNKLPGRGAGFWGNLWSAGKKKAKQVAKEVVSRGKEHLKSELRNVAGAAQESLVNVANRAKTQLHGHYQQGKQKLTQHARKFESTARSYARKGEGKAQKATTGFFNSLFGF